MIQYLIFRIDKAIEMLLDGKTDRIDVVLYLENIKSFLSKPEKEVLDGDFKEISNKRIEERELIE